MFNYVKQLKADDDEFGKQDHKIELVTIDQVFTESSCPNERLKTYVAERGKKQIDVDL